MQYSTVVKHLGWVLVLSFIALTFVGQPAQAKDFVELPAEVMWDKIRGGLLGQMLGNLNGIHHEMQYINEPGNVTEYTPALPEGARTDDDTDFE